MFFFSVLFLCALFPFFLFFFCSFVFPGVTFFFGFLPLKAAVRRRSRKKIQGLVLFDSIEGETGWTAVCLTGCVSRWGCFVGVGMFMFECMYLLAQVCG